MAVSSQAFPSQAASSYVSVPGMTTVIQHRMPATHQPLNQKSCAVTAGGNFYFQANPNGHAPATTPTTAAGPPTVAANQNQANSSCSLAKLQQLTNGLEMIPPTACSTMTPPPPTAMTLTPPPTHHTTMTPPPNHHILQNQRNLPTPPSAIPNLQSQVLGYKYYQPNMNVNQLSGTVTPPMPQNALRSAAAAAAAARNTNVAVQHMQTTSSRASPNVTLNPIMAQYNHLNGYRMATQQTPAVTGYITNTAGFINNTQIPMQMGVMNMSQTQYQDPAAIQRGAPQYTYGYINGSLMQPLNGTMRR